MCTSMFTFVEEKVHRFICFISYMTLITGCISKPLLNINNPGTTGPGFYAVLMRELCQKKLVYLIVDW